MDAIIGSLLGLSGSAFVAYIGGSIAHNTAKYFRYYNEFETEKIKPSDLRICDHIFVPGSKSHSLKVKGLVGYYHHGIYLGLIDGEHMVTDFGTVNRTLPVIRKLDDFLKDYSDQLYRRKYKVPSKVLSPEKTLEYARSICSGKHRWEGYSLFTTTASITHRY